MNSTMLISAVRRKHPAKLGADYRGCPAAPSALNAQPWRFWAGATTSIYSAKGITNATPRSRCCLQVF